MGSGLTQPKDIRSNGMHFNKINPYGFIYKNNSYGFFSEKNSVGDTIITNIWELDTDSNRVFYHPIPNSNISNIEALVMDPDSEIVIIGSKDDSLISVIFFDSIIHKNIQFTAAADFKGIGFPNGHTELIFGRKGSILGHIYRISDTTEMRTYDLPNFFNRICNISQVFIEENKWRFLLQTDFYRKNEVWIILDTSKKSNYLIFDERAVYPEYPGILKIHGKTALEIMDYTFSARVPQLPQKDSLLLFTEHKFKLIQPYKHKELYTAWAIPKIDTVIWSICSIDNKKQSSGFLSNNYLLNAPDFNLPYLLTDSAFHFLIPSSKNNKQIFYNKDEYPVALLRNSPKTMLLLSNQLNYAILDKNGVSIERKNFFKLIHSSIYRIYPEKRQLLEVTFPEGGAIRYLLVLYGLFPLWLISLVITWLIKVLKRKSKFHTRESSLTLSLRLLSGTITYLIILGLSIIKMLHDFSIF